MNLDDLWDEEQPRVTFRRVAVLTSQLRPGSRLAQARMTDDAWTADQYFYAAILDSISHNTWVVANRGVEKAKQSRHPDPMNRPADERKKASKADRASREAARFALMGGSVMSTVPHPAAAEMVKMPLSDMAPPPAPPE